VIDGVGFEPSSTTNNRNKISHLQLHKTRIKHEILSVTDDW